MLPNPAHIGLGNVAFWYFETIGSDLALQHLSTHLNDTIFGAQSLQLTLTACKFSCLRLTNCITTICPRLDTKCAGSALSRQRLQLLAEWRFRGAPKFSSTANDKIIKVSQKFLRDLVRTCLLVKLSKFFREKKL
jgi:hypothetical protein